MSGLLERDRELAELEALLGDARDGCGGVALVEGTAGIGKTSLLREARARARGLNVLSAVGGELERDFGFGVVRQLIEPALARAEPSERGELMAGAARHAEPVFAEAPAAGGDPTHAVLHGLYWLVANLAERQPLLLSVDDIQWADGPSLRFLLYLVRRLEGLPAAIAIALRTGEPAEKRELLPALLLEIRSPILRPAPLSGTAIQSMVTASLGADAGDELPLACHEATAGNPFLMVELLQALRGGKRSAARLSPSTVKRLGPERIAAALLARTASAGPGATQFARAIAVLGERASLADAAELAGLDGRDARQLVHMLNRGSVLAPGEPLRFVHPIVRTAVYEDIPGEQREELHARAAAMLARGSANVDAIAVHLLGAAPNADGRVVQTLRAAARVALSQGAPEAAVRYLRRAVLEPPSADESADVLAELGRAEMVARDPLAAEHLQAALDATDDPLDRARAGADLADTVLFLGQRDRVFTLLRAAVTDVGDRDPDLALMLEGKLVSAAVGIDGGWEPGADAQLPRLLARAREQRDSARPLRLSLGMLLALRSSPASEVLELIDSGLDDGRFLASEGAEPLAAAHAALSLIFVDQLDRAVDLSSQMLLDGSQRGSALGFASGSIHRAFACLRRGDLAEAESDALAVLDLARQHELPFSVAFVHNYLADILLEQGRTGEASELLLTLPQFGPTRLVALDVRGRLRRVLGQRDAAIDDLRACQRTCEALAIRHPGVGSWRSQLALALAGESPRQARELIDSELGDARRAQVPRCIGVAVRALGLIERGERQIELLTQAVSVLDRSQARLEYARALVDLGAALRRAGQRAEAREKLALGMDLAHRCGAGGLAASAREELHAMGARPRRFATTGRDALTPSEGRVAARAAQGMSNKEIAQALFVTLRTVEMHLSNSYAKLDISSRQQLPEALQRTAGP